MSGIGGAGGGGRIDRTGVEGVPGVDEPGARASDAAGGGLRVRSEAAEARAYGSRLSGQLAIEARVLEAEGRLLPRGNVGVPFPVAVRAEEVPPSKFAERPLYTPAQIEKDLVSKDPQARAEAMHELARLAEENGPAAVAILAKLPEKRALEIAAWVHDRIGRKSPGGADWFLIELSKKFPLPFTLENLPEVPEKPSLTPAHIEKGMAAKGFEHVEAMHALQDLAESNPKAAVAILKKLPFDRAAEIATWIRGRLAGPEWGASESFMLALAGDPEFAGRWAAELAKGLKIGGTARTTLLPPGVTDPKAAVAQLVERNARDPKQLDRFIGSMWKQGGDEALAYTLSSLSDAGPTPGAVAFLRGLKGDKCNNYIGRILGSKDKALTEERTQVETAIGEMLQNIPLVSSDQKAWSDIAGQVLGAAGEAIGNNAAGQAEFGRWLKSLDQRWDGKGMVGFLRGTDAYQRQTEASQSTESVEIKREFTALKQQYAEAHAEKDYSKRIDKLRALHYKLEELQNKLDVNLKVDGPKIGIWKFKVDLDAEIDYERQWGEKKGTAGGVEIENELVRLRTSNRQMFASLEQEIETYSKKRETAANRVKTDENLSRTAEAHVDIVREAIRNASPR